MSVEPKELHDLAHAPDGWWQVTSADPFFILSLPEQREVLGVEIDFEMERSSPDTSVTGTRVMWAQTPAEGFLPARGYWLHLPMPQGRTTWKFWMYANANAIRIQPDWRPFRMKLLAARALVAPAVPVRENTPDH